MDARGALMGLEHMDGELTKNTIVSLLYAY